VRTLLRSFVLITTPPGGATVSGVKVSVSACDAHLSQITLTIDKRVARSTGTTLNYSWKLCQTPKKVRRHCYPGCRGDRSRRQYEQPHGYGNAQPVATVTPLRAPRRVQG
jgi:hypothetical protein